MKYTLYVITYDSKLRAIVLFYNLKGFSATMNPIFRDESITFFFGGMGWNGFSVGDVHTVSKNTAIQFIGENNDHSLAMRAAKLQHKYYRVRLE